MLNVTMHKHIPSIVTQKSFIQRARRKTGVAEVRILRKHNIISVKSVHRAPTCTTRKSTKTCSQIATVTF